MAGAGQTPGAVLTGTGTAWPVPHLRAQHLPAPSGAEVDQRGLQGHTPSAQIPGSRAPGWRGGPWRTGGSGQEEAAWGSVPRGRAGTH